MDNSEYEIVGNTNQPSSIELDTIYEKVDLDKPEDTCTKLVTQQDIKKPNCKPSSACFMTVGIILALLLALLTLSLTTSWILTTEPESDSFSEREYNHHQQYYSLSILCVDSYGKWFLSCYKKPEMYFSSVMTITL